VADRTFEQLRDEVLHDDFDSSTYRVRAEEAINDALREIARKIDLPLMQGTSTVSLTSGTGAYSLPTGFVRIKSLKDDDSDDPLDPVSIDFFDDLDDSPGTPEVYAVYGGQLHVWPVPNSSRTLTLRYRGVPATFTDVGDPVSSVLPDELAHLVVKYARSRLFALEDDQPMADFWRAQFDRDVMVAKGDLQMTSGRTTRKIGRRRIRPFPRVRRP
jgi:hypothetical protein